MTRIREEEEDLNVVNKICVFFVIALGVSEFLYSTLSFILHFCYSKQG